MPSVLALLLAMAQGAAATTADEFIEIFELAEPGKAFQVYSRNSFRRANAS